MFDIYLKAARAGMDMVRLGLQISETMTASSLVIDRRLGLIKAAAADPIAGDYAELALMVPEKIEAFSRAGLVLAESWWAMQRDLADQARQIGMVALSGKPPSARQVETIARRSARTAARAAAGAGAAVAPIHKAATANARRLAKPDRKSRRPS